MINWKVRFKNKVWLLAFVAFILSFLYSLADMFGVIPPFAMDTVLDTIATLIQILVFMGIVVDPTTKGIQDSERAKGYSTPYEPPKKY